MKNLVKYIEEKLKINKNFKVDELQWLDNIFEILTEKTKITGGNGKPYYFTIKKNSKNNIDNIWDDIVNNILECRINELKIGIQYYHTFEEAIENNAVYCDCYEETYLDNYTLVTYCNGNNKYYRKLEFSKFDDVIFVSYRPKTTLHEALYSSGKYIEKKSFYVPIKLLDKFEEYCVDKYNEKKQLKNKK